MPGQTTGPTKRSPTTSATQPTLGQAIRASAGQVLAAVEDRRLRLNGLPVFERRLVAAGLGTGAVAVVVLMATPLGVALPGGGITLLRSDAPRIGWVQLAVSFVAIGLALGLLAAGAAQPAWRLWRFTIVAVAGVGLFMTPTVLTIDRMTLPALLAGLLGLAAAVALLAIALVGRPRRAPLLAGLAAAPPILAFLAIVAAGLGGAPPGLQNEVATSVLNGVTVIEVPLIALAAWGAIEYGRGLAAGARAVARRTHRAGAILAALLVGKVVLLVAAILGVSGTLTGLDRELLTAPLRESPLTLAWAAVLVVVAGWWILRGPRPDWLRADPTAGGWLIIGGVLVGFLLPDAIYGAGLLPERFGLRQSQAQILEWSAVVDSVQTVALALTPVVVSVLALLVGALLAVRGQGGRRAVGLLLLVYAAWTLIPAIAFGLNQLELATLSDANGGPLGQVNVVTLDLLLTGLVAALAGAWVLGLQRTVPPPALVAVLLLGAFLAYGGRLFTAELGVALFWLGFGFAFAVQFVLDADALNRDEAGREARVLGATGLSALALGLALPLVALGFAGPDRASLQELVKVFFLVPFVGVLAAGVLADMPIAAPEARPMRRLGRLPGSQATLAAVGILVVGGAVGLLAFQEPPPPPPDTAIERGNGFTIRIPPEYGMAYSDRPTDTWLSADGERGIVAFAYPLVDAEGRDPLEAALELTEARLAANDSEIVSPMERTELPAGPAMLGRARGPVASGGEFTVVTLAEGRRAWDLWIINFDPDAALQTLESIRFTEE